MKKEWKFFIVAVAIIVTGGLVGLYAVGKTAPDLGKNNQSGAGQVAGATTINNGDYVTRLAKALTAKGVVLYGSYQSNDLKQQKNFFGQASAELNYVECDATGPNANPDECLGRNIQIYPTWVYQEKQYSGIQPLADLAKLINFSE